MPPTSAEKTVTRSGRKSLRIVGLFVAALGLVAVNAMLPTLRNASTQAAWTRGHCTIDAASLKSDEYGTDSIVVAYHYTVDGRLLHGSRYEVASNVSRSEVYYKRELERFLPGVDVECFYDPAAPEEVVLKRVTWGDAAIIVIPALFLVLGLAMLLGGRGKKPRDLAQQAARMRETAEAEMRSVRGGGAQPAGRGWGRILFFSLFIAAGLGVTYLLFGMPYLALREAQSWTPSRCTIIESRVAMSSSRDSKSGKSSTSYSLNVRYRYQVGERHYVGTEYNPAADRFLASDTLYEIANALTPESEVECFVDPADATRAMLNREVPLRMYLGLFPMIFAAAGFLGLLATGAGRGPATQRGRIERRAAPRLKNFVSYLLLTVVVNALIGAVIFGICFDSNWQVVQWMPLLIASPFLLLGGLMIVGLPYAFLQLFNPTVDLELSTEKARFGAPFSVGWKLSGNPRRVKELVIEMRPDWEREYRNSDDGDETGAGEEGDDLDEDEKSEGEATPAKSAAQPATAASKLQEIQRLLKLEVIKPFSTTNTQTIKSGRTEFAIPSREQMVQMTSGVEVKGWRITVRLKIPWYPDSMETHRVSCE